ncbi:MAG: 4'-phosphopantetheinyl transferase family protein [Bacteroidales bacterium]
MPVIRSYKTENIEWAIWKIEESEESLISLLSFSKSTIEQALSYTSSVRRKEFLAVRALLYHLFHEVPVITYNEHGKPFLDNHLSISISHTKGRYAAVLISDHPMCGIDIEFKNERVRNVVTRFITASESSFLSPEDTIQLNQLLLIWSAKETLFKSIEEPEIDFLRHLHTEPFTPQPGFGVFRASENKSKACWEGNIYYLLEDDFVMTWL